MRPGQLMDAVSISADESESDYANDVAKVAAIVRPRRTAAKVQIVPIAPVAARGRVFGFVVTVAATERTPGVMPTVCATLPKGLRVTRAPGAVAGPSRVCWSRSALVAGQPTSFRFSARVGSVPSSGAMFAVRARIRGENFTPARASTVVQVTPRPVACTSSLGGWPTATIAC